MLLREFNCFVVALLLGIPFAQNTVQADELESGLTEVVAESAEPKDPALNKGSKTDCDDCEYQKGCCTCEEMNALNKKIAGAYKGVFYDNDYSFLCDPCYDQWWPGDNLKRRAVTDWLTVDFGGQYRARLHNERNMRGLGITGRDDDFLLHRTRLFLNGQISHWGRVYVEYIDAVSNYENFPPRPIEENRSDLQNLFGELKLYENCRGELWVRAGRQELLYGPQRLVSPLDWANTRRTFDGYKVFWRGTDWNVDAFYTRPMHFEPGKSVKFDNPDYEREFMGIYSTYKGRPNNTYDLYFLRYNNDRGPNNFRFNTLGGRWQGTDGDWKWDMEAAVQFGKNSDGSDHAAGMCTIGGGYTHSCHCWKPTLWLYYDWASGDNTIGNGFDHLFPLAHKYLGWMDLFGRRNIQDLNLLFTVQPHDKLKLTAWFHTFWLANGNDIPYSVVMGPSPTIPGVLIVPGGSNYLGQELDLLASYTINARTNILVGYSHFFSGSWFDSNPSALPYRGDADFVYTQFQVNF